MAIAGTKLSPVPKKLNDFRSEMLLGCPTLTDGHGHWNHQASEVKPTVVHNHLYLAVSRPAGRGLMVQGSVLQNMAVLTSFIGSGQNHTLNHTPLSGQNGILRAI